MQKIALHFGAGNIGRGLVGMLLAQAGYRVIFADVAEKLVGELQRRGCYKVEVAAQSLDSVIVSGVSARLFNDPELPQILASAELISTAVGGNALVHVAKSIASSFRCRTASSLPQYIIACENMIRASSTLKCRVEEQLLATGQIMPANVYFSDAAVDRVVPSMAHEDPLTVRVERYHEWLVEGTAEADPELAKIVGLNLVPDLTPFLKRKIYTVNTGHACAAWHGFRLGFARIDAALADTVIREIVAKTVAESSKGLCDEYGLDLSEQQQYCSEVLKRFENPYIIDDVLRVGRQPLRKLSAGERIHGPLQLAQKHGNPVDYLLRGAAAALLFRNERDPDACDLQQELQGKGLDAFMADRLSHMGEHNLRKIKQYYNEYKKTG